MKRSSAKSMPATIVLASFIAFQSANAQESAYRLLQQLSQAKHGGTQSFLSNITPGGDLLNVGTVFCRALCGSGNQLICSAASEEPDEGSCAPVDVTLPQTQFWLDITGDPRLESAELYPASGNFDNNNIPSGYTFFGQFIDHDMTAGTEALARATSEVTAERVMAIARTRDIVMDDVFRILQTDDQDLMEDFQPTIDRIEELKATALQTFGNNVGQPMVNLPRQARDQGAMSSLAESLASPDPGVEDPSARRRSGLLDLDSAYGPATNFDRLNDLFSEASAATGVRREELCDDPDANIVCMFEADNGMPTGRFALQEIRRDGLSGYDMPRRSNYRALIADGRNDENKIIASMHALFLQLHNQCFDHQVSALSPEAAELTPQVAANAFDACRVLVPQVYQTIILTDYLPRHLSAEISATLIGSADPSTASLQTVAENDDDFQLYAPESTGMDGIPESFAVAAFRMGHSQLRNNYGLRDGEGRSLFDDEANADAKACGDAGRADDLIGNRPYCASDLIDWRFFFDIGPWNARQFSQLIDLRLPVAVGRLPEAALPPANLEQNGEIVTGTDTPSERNLARRNIQRASETGGIVERGQHQLEDITLSGAVSLASMQAFSDALEGEIGTIVETITDHFDSVPALEGSQIPLWIGILAEAQAESEGERLGKIGSIIVGEVILAKMLENPYSILNRSSPEAGIDPNGWEPMVAIRSEGRYAFGDMINYLEQATGDTLHTPHLR